MRKSPRDRRLRADFRSVEQLLVDSTIFSCRASGNPPQRYEIAFRGAGFKQATNGKIVVAHQHNVIVELGAAYPRMVPHLAWQTPIFHPNISDNGIVCLGSYGTYWVPSLTLSEMCTMLWDMIRYRNFDTESPYNREAALWAKHQTEFKFPIDGRSIRDRIAEGGASVDEVSVTVVGGDPASPDSQSDDGIEIIETGIEIVETVLPERPDDGIFYID